MKKFYVSIIIILVIIFLMSFFLGKTYENFTSSTDNNGNITYTGDKGNSVTVTKNDNSNTNKNTTTTSNNSNDDITTSGNVSVGSSVYDNYNHYSGSSYPTILYGPNGTTAKFSSVGGIESVIVSYPNGTSEVFYINTNTGNTGNIQTYTDSSGNNAVIIVGNDNSISLQVTKNGKTILFTEKNIYTDTNSINVDNTYINKKFYNQNGDYAQFIYKNGKIVILVNYSNGKTNIYYLNANTGNYGSSQKYTDAYGNTASLVYTNGNPTIVITNKDGTTTVYSLVNNNYTTLSSNDVNNYANYGYNYSSPYNTTNATQITGPYGGNTDIVSTPYGTTVGYTPPSSVSNYSTTPNYYGNMGIPQSQIPPGKEDLYILKSQVVPPVCPVCPEPIIKTCKEQEKNQCPPCPPCARCPEPPFKCVKEPNYESPEVSKYLPQPVLADFSNFGM